MSENTQTQISWILPLNSGQANLATVGGKGANLALLSRAGMQVPGGFLVTTRAYQAFIEANQLEEQIRSALPSGGGEDPDALEEASAQIRALFAAGTLPIDLSADLLAAYNQLAAEEEDGQVGPIPVAVRSSATAEDLPEMSFAGQQDTYLNVVGGPTLLQAVVRCWGSLWTARAIGYRARNGLDPMKVALAVVVQKMVQSEASGVLFTANPLTGVRSETVIDATLGLGEALVSGQVEPDHYVVDTANGRITSRRLGAKALSIRGQAGGGTTTLSEAALDRQALPDEQILELARLGQRVETLYGFPQDIEWAWAEGQLYLLQSRAVTSLYPIPEGMGADDLKVMFSFAAVQGMLDPITPLGLDMLRTVFAVGAGIFGFRVNSQTQTAVYAAGERLWVNITSLTRSTVGRKIVPVALEMVEPAAGQAILTILDDPRLRPAHKGIRPRTMIRLARFFVPMVGNLLLNLISPESRRESIVAGGEKTLEVMRERARAIQGDRYSRLAQQADLIGHLADQKLPYTLIRFVSLVAAGVASFNILNQLCKNLPTDDPRAEQSGWQNATLEVYRGLPHNPTTEMDLALWQTAQAIHNDPAAERLFSTLPPAELASRYKAGDLPEGPARRAIADFLERYGGRGLGEIDLGRPRWQEDPTHVIEALGSFLQIKDPQRAPDVVFTGSARSAEQAVAGLAAAVRRTRGGWLKARLVHFFAGRARSLLGARESPKFFAVRLFGVLRQALLETGKEFVQAGELGQADDLMYLSLEELKTFAAEAPARVELRTKIAARRETFRRELLRRQVPRLLLSDGRAFYEGVRAKGAQAGVGISGSPVSPGTATGMVRVVLDPRQAHLQPGEILVCPGTDPSWTPLFMTAGGLVMEVGGMMTHGAVVAREYGIPAIVGVDQATQRLHTGQKIRIDGSSGEIVVLEEK